MIKLRRNVLHYFLFENQSIYMRCHKSFGINLGGGGGQTVLCADYIYSPFLVLNLSIMDGYLQR